MHTQGAAARLCAAAWLAAVCGCATGGRTAALESQLRRQEDRLIATERQLEEARQEAEAARLQVAKLQAAPDTPAAAVERPEKLAFASLLTGGVDEDGTPGDEAVRAVIQPLRKDGTSIPAPGRLEVELLDVAAAPQDRVRGKWAFTGEDLRGQWDAGLFASGYTMELVPEDGVLPEDALLIARFVAPDGSQVEATRTLRLNTAEDLTVFAGDAGPIKDGALLPVSATERPLSDADLTADFPDELPVREPPAEEPEPGDPSANPFADFMQSGEHAARRPVRTSDNWTSATIPVLR